MILVRDKKDRVVLFTGQEVSQTDSYLCIDGTKSYSYTEESVELVEYLGELPIGFLSNCWTYEDGGVWEVRAGYETVVQRQRESEAQGILTDKKQNIESLRKVKVYSDVLAEFPTGTGVIQFRNESDRSNISNVATGAMAYVLAGAPETEMSYRTEDNMIHKVPAGTMMTIAMSVLAGKQKIVDVAWKHKDALIELMDEGDYEALREYDTTTGW